jgi:hypothetical protein
MMLLSVIVQNPLIGSGTPMLHHGLMLTVCEQAQKMFKCVVAVVRQAVVAAIVAAGL